MAFKKFKVNHNLIRPLEESYFELNNKINTLFIKNMPQIHRLFLYKKIVLYDSKENERIILMSPQIGLIQGFILIEMVSSNSYITSISYENS